jgi:hypothetical protein
MWEESSLCLRTTLPDHRIRNMDEVSSLEGYSLTQFFLHPLFSLWTCLPQDICKELALVEKLTSAEAFGGLGGRGAEFDATLELPVDVLPPAQPRQSGQLKKEMSEAVGAVGTVA